MRALREGVLPALVAILIAGGTARAQAQLHPACVESVMVNIAWGESAECFSRGDTVGTAMTPGPLFNVEDGTVYVLDRVDGRLLVFDRRGGPVRRDPLPTMGLPVSLINDIWVSGNRVFLLGEESQKPQVFIYDLEEKTVADLPLAITGDMRSDPTRPTRYSFLLAEGAKGIYLFQLSRQASMKIFDGAPVPPDKQVPEDGLVVGNEHLRYPVRGGVMKTVSGRVVASGMLTTFGDGRIVVRRDDQGSDMLTLVDVEKGPLVAMPRPRRHRVKVTPTAPFRLAGGWYELYLDAKHITVSKWICAGS